MELMLQRYLSIPVGASFLINGVFNQIIYDGSVVFKSDQIGPVVLGLTNSYHLPLKFKSMLDV